RDAGRRRRQPVLPLPEEEKAGSGRSAEQQCQTRELGKLISRAVAELPPHLREVLALRHDQEMNFEEMSRLLGVPASTLKSRFSAALVRLRERLREWGYPEEGES